MMQKQWIRANLELVSKALAELLYEEVLHADFLGPHYVVNLKNNVSYKFSARIGAWGFLQIDPESIKRNPATAHVNAATFFQDANTEMGMSSITLTHFLEEMNNTLFSEMRVLENKANIRTAKLTQLSGEALHPYLSGHPKILLNKGRLGFSTTALKQFAPEYSSTFQVYWVAVNNSIIHQSETSFHVESILNKADLDLIQTQLDNLKLTLKDYSLIPVHPWQFDRYIESQYQKEIINNQIVPLGLFGDTYTPQISIRTLSNSENRNSCDLKLSLTILNTSAYRGISGENLHVGPILSDYMENICLEDSLLKNLQTQVLKELYVASVPQSDFIKIDGAPYRFNELLGCVARESAQSKIKESELAIMTGSLFYVGDDHQSLIGEYIRLSKLTAHEWISRYFKHVVIPLYHLQLSYGIGIVSHGQNIVLKLTDFAPSGMFIKDFQGDLRLNKEFIHKFPERLQSLKALPADYLIHDLITGHFVTVLRFISPIMETFKILNEKDFYKILGMEIKSYLEEHHPNLSKSSPLYLLRPEFEKVILNKVRFNIGYEDSSARPLPLLGKNLINPLQEFLKDTYEA